MDDYKICSKCHRAKTTENDFYHCAGKLRSECKGCTIRRNMSYQRRTRAWQYREVDEEERKVYMRAYYNKHKERFAKYRTQFRLRYPDYYKEYFKRKKEAGA